MNRIMLIYQNWYKMEDHVFKTLIQCLIISKINNLSKYGNCKLKNLKILKFTIINILHKNSHNIKKRPMQ